MDSPVARDDTAVVVPPTCEFGIVFCVGDSDLEFNLSGDGFDKFLAEFRSSTIPTTTRDDSVEFWRTELSTGVGDFFSIKGDAFEALLESGIGSLELLLRDIESGAGIENAIRDRLDYFDFGYSQCLFVGCNGLFTEWHSLLYLKRGVYNCPNCEDPTSPPDIIGKVGGLDYERPAGLQPILDTDEIQEMERRYLAIKPAMRVEDKPGYGDDDDLSYGVDSKAQLDDVVPASANDENEAPALPQAIVAPAPQPVAPTPKRRSPLGDLTAWVSPASARPVASPPAPAHHSPPPHPKSKRSALHELGELIRHKPDGQDRSLYALIDGIGAGRIRMAGESDKPT